MPTFAVVETLDVIEHIRPSIVSSAVLTSPRAHPLSHRSYPCPSLSIAVDEKAWKGL